MTNPTLFDHTYIKGNVEMILFQNSDNYYTVLKVDVEETNGDFVDMATVVGFFPNMVEGETYTFKGHVVQHARYGQQLKAETFQKEIPHTSDAVIAYLSSDLFKGIGKKTAESIVNTLGENAIHDILKDESIIGKVPKLSKAKQQQIVEQIYANQESEQVMIRLIELGFGSKLAMDIYKFYKSETLTMLDQNPYQLVYDIKGVGFQKADQLAQQLGIHPQHPDRFKAGLLYLVEETCIRQGHTYLPQEALINETIQLLSLRNDIAIEREQIIATLENLVEEKRLIEVDERIAIPSLYYSEIKSTQNLYRVHVHRDKLTQFDNSDIQLHIGEIETFNEVHYAPSQKDALECAMRHKVMLLTGGPGTGKTTVIKGIVQLYSEIHGISLDYNDYDQDDYPVVLAAPTGRASKRLHEATGLEAMTIHRLIGWNQETKPDDLLENEINAKLIIIDEMSMVDTWLFHQFMAAVPMDAQVVLVGDEDQLPSVGPGQVFKDLIEANVLPRVNLTEVYRQQEGSSIIDLAHRMKLGETVDITQRFHDRSFIPCHTEQIPQVVEKVVKNAVQKGYTMADIQVLAPMYRGNAGIKKLNQILQNILNPLTDRDDHREMEFGDVVFRKGDKVLQLVNRPNDNIFNGDIGVIVGIFWAKENVLNKDVVIVDYDGNEITYARSDLTELTHAYCTSIHKAQGSEFPIVIMPIVKQYFRMLQKPILYTGLTRAKQSLVFLGDSEAFNIGLATAGQTRLTQLLDFLKQYFKTDDPSTDVQDASSTVISLTEETLFKIHPMINMGDVTPYDFMEIDKA